MKSLYVASSGPEGKTAVCVGLGRKLLEKGKRPGYLRPLSLAGAGPAECQDGGSVKAALELAAAPEALCPLVLTREELAQGVNGKAQELDAKLRQAFDAIAAVSDVVLLEGLSGLGTDEVVTKACDHTVRLFDAKVLLLARYSPALTPAGVSQLARGWEDRCLGAVITGAPQAKLAKIAEDTRSSFSAAGVNVIGVLPEDRTLLGISVAELVQVLDAQVLSGASKLEAVVENVMLGVLTQDSGLDYYRRKSNKAAVMRGDRPDMALAALQTDTACLVLTGGAAPPPIVMLEAQKKGTPVLLVKSDGPSTVAAIEKALPEARFRGGRKYDRIEEVMARNMDFDQLWKALGV